MHARSGPSPSGRGTNSRDAGNQEHSDNIADVYPTDQTSWPVGTSKVYCGCGATTPLSG